MTVAGPRQPSSACHSQLHIFGHDCLPAGIGLELTGQQSVRAVHKTRRAQPSQPYLAPPDQAHSLLCTGRQHMCVAARTQQCLIPDLAAAQTTCSPCQCMHSPVYAYMGHGRTPNFTIWPDLRLAWGAELVCCHAHSHTPAWHLSASCLPWHDTTPLAGFAAQHPRNGPQTRSR